MVFYSKAGKIDGRVNLELPPTKDRVITCECLNVSPAQCVLKSATSRHGAGVGGSSWVLARSHEWQPAGHPLPLPFAAPTDRLACLPPLLAGDLSEEDARWYRQTQQDQVDKYYQIMWKARLDPEHVEGAPHTPAKWLAGSNGLYQRCLWHTSLMRCLAPAGAPVDPYPSPPAAPLAPVAAAMMQGPDWEDHKLDLGKHMNKLRALVGPLRQAASCECVLRGTSLGLGPGWRPGQHYHQNHHRHTRISAAGAYKQPTGEQYYDAATGRYKNVTYTFDSKVGCSWRGAMCGWVEPRHLHGMPDGQAD